MEKGCKLADLALRIGAHCRLHILFGDIVLGQAPQLEDQDFNVSKGLGLFFFVFSVWMSALVWFVVLGQGFQRHRWGIVSFDGVFGCLKFLCKGLGVTVYTNGENMDEC